MQTESQIRTMPPVLDKYAQGRMACICLPETSGSGSRVIRKLRDAGWSSDLVTINALVFGAGISDDKPTYGY
jgi:hypothetical protein